MRVYQFRHVGIAVRLLKLQYRRRKNEYYKHSKHISQSALQTRQAISGIS